MVASVIVEINFLWKKLQEILSFAASRWNNETKKGNLRQINRRWGKACQSSFEMEASQKIKVI
jgi:hypothetical protein